jgi:hypothetical protein
MPRDTANLRWCVAAFAILVAMPASATGQLPAPPLQTPVWKWWTSLALGPATASARSIAGSNGGGRLGGDIAIWVTRDQQAFALRDASASRFFDPGDVYDLSFLAGIHPRTNDHVDFVAGVGPGISRGHGTAGEVLPTKAVIAADAQVNFNYRVAGIALDGFATAGQSRWYYGAGLAITLGWFH